MINNEFNRASALEQTKKIGDFYLQHIRESTLNSLANTHRAALSPQILCVFDKAISCLEKHFKNPELPQNPTPTTLFASLFQHEYYQDYFTPSQLEEALAVISESPMELFTFEGIPVVIIEPTTTKYLAKRGMIHDGAAASFCPIEHGLHFILYRVSSVDIPLSEEKKQEIISNPLFRHEVHHIVFTVLKENGLVLPANESDSFEKEMFEALRDEMIAYIITGYNPAFELVANLTYVHFEDHPFNIKVKKMLELLQPVAENQLAWFILPIMRSRNLKQLERNIRIYLKKLRK